MRNLRGSVPMSLLDVIKNGYFQQVRYLVDRGEDLDQKDEERRTALMLCAFIEPEKWGIGICRLLIENGATLFYKDKYGLNAFHYAVIYERVELCRVYLKAIDFNLNEGDKAGNTALHYSVRSGNVAITRLIAQMYVKYRINFEKANNEGYTALDEAKRLNRRKCARILEQPHLLEDSRNLESNIPLDLKFNDTEGETMSFKSSRKSLSRPRSSVLSRRSSRSSLFTASEYSFRRTPTIYSVDVTTPVKRRMPGEDIPPNEKNKKQLIRCASASDIRNNPEYLFSVNGGFENGHVDVQGGAPKRRMRAKSAHVPIPIDGDSSDIVVPKPNWRTEFRKLYLRYEFQCTASYRDSVIPDIAVDNTSLPPLDKPLTPANSEHTIDDLDKGRKPRKQSAVSRQNTDDNLIADRKKSVSKTNTRKISQNVGHGGKLSVDGLESSSESINSSVSSKKQADGKISKQKDSGRTSRNNHHKGLPSVTVDDA
ncbi:hypothetical protein ACF0H5_005214 [Mactra antiquata]